MRIFLSWSKDRSRYLASAFKQWIPSVLQYTDVYMSEKDISLGERWSSNISENLSDHDFGLVFITPENINSPWINFEAGALSKNSSSTLIPIIYKSDIMILNDGPLKQFQSQKDINKECILELIKTINSNASKEIKINEDLLVHTFDKWWPDLEDTISRVPELKSGEQIEESPSENEMLQKIFLKVNELSTHKNPTNPYPIGLVQDIIEIERYLSKLEEAIDFNDMDIDLSNSLFSDELNTINKKIKRVRKHVVGSRKSLLERNRNININRIDIN